MAELAYEHNGARVARERFYAIACDPRRSVAVEACAGAGKTWMLVSRILRALLAGSAPQEVLAITFTRKAAGEMRERLAQWLAQFARADDATLEAALRDRGVPASELAAQREALRGLHAALLQAGRPVQIRTFHSWFAALLRSAPLAVLEQLGLPASHELLEDDGEAVALVWRRFHGAVAADAAARRDFEDCVAAHGRANTRKALETALARRVEFALADAHGVVDDAVQPFGALFRDLAPFATPEASLAGEGARRRWLARAAALGAEANATPQKAANCIVDAFAVHDPAERLALLRKALFVADEDRLRQHLARYPAAQEAEAELQPLCAAAAQHQAWLHHQRLARLARVLLREFAADKRERGWIDMNDVERAALALLSDPVLSGWVQERLDLRVRHLLIDEFQDTNPLQWQALHAWLSSYAGAAGAPSVFIVGDPKQSIYRFRRAEPQVFRAAQAFLREALGGDMLACDHTHRNAPALLAAVNAAMGQAQQAGEYEGFRDHTTESRAAGQVLQLPPIPRARPAAGAAADGDGPAWRDSLATPRELPEEHLTALECRQAAAWIAAQLATGVAPGDVMVLARKRDRLAAMEDALRALHIPAQQPEKADLGDAPEVQDIVALLDVLVSPAHDLSLARALRSPLFEAGEDALVQLALRARALQAAGTPRPWLELLLKDEEGALPLLRDAGPVLARWKGWVDRLPPHDALDAIFHDGDVLARYARRAPPALRDAVLANLRALLGAALDVDGGRYATPYGFVRALKAGGVRGPALAVPGAVKLLTVHGAKGLEAPLVLLLDTDAPPERAQTMGVIVEWPGEAPAPWRFAFLASESRPPACSTDAMAVELAARQREELNALYVAMTRARQTLVLSSVQAHGPAPGSWWKRLAPLATPVEAPPAAAALAPAGPGTVDLPVVPALREVRAPVAAAPAAAASAASRFGQAVHRLLERWSPRAWPQGALPAVAREFALAADQAARAAAMAQRIAQGEGAWAWDASALAWHGNEVELLHGGELLRLDRLVQVRGSGEWWVLDYKSASVPERDAALVAQMQRYRAAVQVAQPGAVVRLAFLTGDGRLVGVD